MIEQPLSQAAARARGSSGNPFTSRQFLATWHRFPVTGIAFGATWHRLSGNLNIVAGRPNMVPRHLETFS